MRCRETILIAVLINLGLLAILFATARSVDVEEAIVASAPAPTSIIEREPFHPIALPTPIGRDEIDQALESYRRAEIVKPVELAAAPPAPAPAPAVEPPPALPLKSIEITVKKGETLDKIARANGTTIERLIEVNGLKTTRLQIGQKLVLPDEPQPIKLPQPAGSPVGNEEFYTVASGDNPWVIANKFRIPLDELLRINRLDEASAKRLKPGDRIRIR